MDYQIIEVNNKKYNVVKHWFWDKFNKEFWEKQTYDIFQKYIDKNTTYVDIGAYLGITLIYASQFTDRIMYGVEANPLSFEMLVKNCKPLKTVLDNICITDKDNVLVSFGGKDNQKNTSSASNINGNCWQIKSNSLFKYYNCYGLVDCRDLFIKIDIEGAEELLLYDLSLINTGNITIHLSLHPPFIKNKEVFCRNLLEVCQMYKYVLDSNMNELPLECLRQRILTDIPYPSWGTRWGNFFEIVLTNKDLIREKND